MFAGLVLTRLLRGAALSLALSLGMIACGVGVAVADVADASARSEGPVTRQVLGVPLGTAAWAVFGLTMLVAGLMAASRSRQHVATGLGAKTDNHSVVSGISADVADVGRSVSAV